MNGQHPRQIRKLARRGILLTKKALTDAPKLEFEIEMMTGQLGEIDHEIQHAGRAVAPALAGRVGTELDDERRNCGNEEKLKKVDVSLK